MDAETLCSIAATLDSAAEVLLGIAALYVSGMALSGWWNEYRAKSMDEGDRKNERLANARARYAVASFQKPWVLGCVFLGAFTKAALAIGSLLI